MNEYIKPPALELSFLGIPTPFRLITVFHVVFPSQDIFARIKSEQDKQDGEDARSYRLQLSYLEIYKEEVSQSSFVVRHGALTKFKPYPTYAISLLGPQPLRDLVKKQGILNNVSNFVLLGAGALVGGAWFVNGCYGRFMYATVSPALPFVYR